MTAPALTTVRQPLQQMAETAVSLLLARLDETANGERGRHLLATSLVVRDSTAPPGGGASRKERP
jgi:DNA-binding LacI/PurR family transcriptional regulator